MLEPAAVPLEKENNISLTTFSENLGAQSSFLALIGATKTFFFGRTEKTSMDSGK